VHLFLTVAAAGVCGQAVVMTTLSRNSIRFSRVDLTHIREKLQRTMRVLKLLRMCKTIPEVSSFRSSRRALCNPSKPVEDGALKSTQKAVESNAKITTEPSHHDINESVKTSTFSSYTQAINHSIGDIEKILMERIHESNQRRFRIMFFSSAAFIITFFVLFGGTITKKLKSLTTGLALETLEDKSIKIQTQELAMAVVQTVLNDKDVTAQAASFLREAAQTPETQEALLKLTLHVLQHPDSVKELSLLTKQVLADLADDEVRPGSHPPRHTQPNHTLSISMLTHIRSKQ
jgi:hypothetical protein